MSKSSFQKWVRVAPEDKESDQVPESDGQDRIKVISYNVLADYPLRMPAFRPKYVTDHDNSFEGFESDVRRANIVSFLLEEQADIVCLQECDIPGEWITDMRKIGYEGKYTRTSPEYNFKKELVTDPKSMYGIMTFYKVDRFEPILHKVVSFASNIRGDEDPKYPFQFDPKEVPISTAGTVFVLRDLKTSEIFITGNGHVYFNPVAGHYKFRQFLMLLYDIRLLRELFLPENKVTVFIGIDKNATPDSVFERLVDEGHYAYNESDIAHDYELADGVHINNDSKGVAIKSIRVGFEDHVPRYIKGAHEESPVLQNLWQEVNRRKYSREVHGRMVFGTPVVLESAYKSQYGPGVSTMFAKTYNASVDYLYYNSDTWAPESLLSLPKDKKVKRVDMFPNLEHPSDHVPLAVIFKKK